MELYRVFPYLPEAEPGEPGHPLYVHPDQGGGRWDNPQLYRAVYLASSPAAAIGETFSNLTRWNASMLPFPLVPGSLRVLGVYRLDEETHPLLDLDDPMELVQRSLRPTDIVKRNRPKTQRIAEAIFRENRWAGISWWSMHRPQWTLHAVWTVSALKLHHVEPLAGHVGLHEAADLLAKELDPHLKS